MNAILGMSYLALRAGLDGTQKGYIESVERSARSLLGIINEILDFSKIEAGKLELEAVEFELDAVLTGAMDLVVQSAARKGIELVFDLSPDLPVAVVGDVLRLKQVLVNLLSNAVKFTERGAVNLAIRVIKSEGDTIVLRFFVTDSGIGMSREQQAQLFQPFTQADASMSRRYGGTGLGLTISHRLVHLMGGVLNVASIEGKGSAFSFTIPLIRVPERAPRAAEPAGTVLLIDAIAVRRSAIAAMFQAHGWQCAHASDGGDGRRYARNAAACDVVIVDSRMVETPGTDALKELAESFVGSTPAFVLLAPLGAEDLVKSITRPGRGDLQVATKPIAPRALLSLCQSLIARPLSADVIQLRDGRARSSHLASLKDARILLVDDDELNQILAVELLSQEGVAVTVAENGVAALESLERAPFDLVLMDCQMPIMDGYEATRRIRASPRLGELPIIAMTANAMAGDRERAIATGMNDHISKPIDTQALFEVVQRWLQSARARSS